MRKLGLSLVTFLVISASTGSVDAQNVPEPQGDPNAAMKYWQAFALLPQMDKEQEKIVENWNTVPLDDAAVKLIESASGSLANLHRGAKQRECNWSLNYEDGAAMLMPHLQRSRTLARFACLRARYRFEQGQAEAAVDDLLAAMTLARHLAGDWTMISLLVQYAIEHTAIEALSTHLNRIDPQILAKLPSRLEMLPPGGSLKRTMRSEKEFSLEWTIRWMKDLSQSDPAAWQAEVIKMFFLASDEQAGAQLVKKTPPQEMIQFVEKLRPFYDGVISLLDAPADQFDAQYTAMVTKTKEENPASAVILPDISNVVASLRNYETRHALLRAAIAVKVSGPDRLKDFPDPFGQGPFKYRPTQNGFELTAKFNYRNKPVTLTVGIAKKD